MQTRTYYGRPDQALGETGVIQFTGDETGRAVALAFRGPEINFMPHNGWPVASQTLKVNGVKRHYWVEFVAALRRRPDLRDVAGQDLRHQEVAVITTDDGRRYAFLTELGLPKEVIEAIPPGRRRTIQAEPPVLRQTAA